MPKNHKFKSYTAWLEFAVEQGLQIHCTMPDHFEASAPKVGSVGYFNSKKRVGTCQKIQRRFRRGHLLVAAPKRCY